MRFFPLTRRIRSRFRVVRSPTATAVILMAFAAAVVFTADSFATDAPTALTPQVLVTVRLIAAPA